LHSVTDIKTKRACGKFQEKRPFPVKIQLFERIAETASCHANVEYRVEPQRIHSRGAFPETGKRARNLATGV
jgi:hypothetical protein